jgi:hypothetical protein
MQRDWGETMKCPDCLGTGCYTIHPESGKMVYDGRDYVECPTCKGTGEVPDHIAQVDKMLKTDPKEPKDVHCVKCGAKLTAHNYWEHSCLEEVPDPNNVFERSDFRTLINNIENKMALTPKDPDPKEPHKLYHCSKCGETFDHENHKDWHEERCKIDPKSHQEVAESFKPNLREISLPLEPLYPGRLIKKQEAGEHIVKVSDKARITSMKRRGDELYFEAVTDAPSPPVEKPESEGRRCKCGREMERQWVCETCGEREG